MVRLRNAAVWVGTIFLAVAFVAVGLSKLEGTSAIRWSERFGQWGYPADAAYVVGVIEIVGGLGVLIPRWRRTASLTLSVLMAGALSTHLVHAEFPRVIPPLVLGGVACLMYWSLRRPAVDRPS
jgi:putative oxidoreductase